jgi:hypothetical protein
MTSSSFSNFSTPMDFLLPQVDPDLGARKPLRSGSAPTELLSLSSVPMVCPPLVSSDPSHERKLL